MVKQPIRARPGRSPHRSHAVIEQVFAELIDGPLAHLPSGRFKANNARLACIAIAHNLTRAAATLAGRPHHTARIATIRRHLINVAGRVTRHAREITIHLPQHSWHGFSILDGTGTAFSGSWRQPALRRRSASVVRL